jgi:hypothetical protein
VAGNAGTSLLSLYRSCKASSCLAAVVHPPLIALHRAALRLVLSVNPHWKVRPCTTQWQYEHMVSRVCIGRDLQESHLGHRLQAWVVAPCLPQAAAIQWHRSSFQLQQETLMQRPPCPCNLDVLAKGDARLSGSRGNQVKRSPPCCMLRHACQHTYKHHVAVTLHHQHTSELQDGCEQVAAHKNGTWQLQHNLRTAHRQCPHPQLCAHVDMALELGCS